MVRYRYRALGSGGEILRGEADAASEAEIAAQLQKRGAMALGISPVGSGLGWLAAEIGGAPALRRGELVDVTRELASMLGAGQDLDRALRFMTEGALNRRVAGVLGRIRDLVREALRSPVLCSASRKAFRASISVSSARARPAVTSPIRWSALRRCSSASAA